VKRMRSSPATRAVRRSNREIDAVHAVRADRLPEEDDLALAHLDGDRDLREHRIRRQAGSRPRVYGTTQKVQNCRSPA
jgi:hypothetical protein